MAFIFPEDKDDFRAPNGVVYKWDGTKWVVKAFLSTDDIKEYVDAADSKLQLQIDRLKEQVDILNEITKGSVARYALKNTDGTPVSRPGEFSTNTGFYSSISVMSFGTADADGNPTKEMVNGNIIETFDAEENTSNRFAITDASGAPTIVNVKYVSGNSFYILGREVEVNIY